MDLWTGPGPADSGGCAAGDRLDFEHVIEPVGGVVEELLGALDALAAEDLAPLFGPALLERLRPLLVLQNRLAAEIARTVREGEVSGAAEVDGLKSMASWLRGHGHLSDAEAARVVRAGRALEHLPTMAAAFAAGRSEEHTSELQSRQYIV